MRMMTSDWDDSLHPPPNAPMLWREGCAAGPREFELTLTEFASAHTCAGLAADVLGLQVLPA